jgi:MoaA/NifB/PqqE/SkfB family radical SAM enzyme
MITNNQVTSVVIEATSHCNLHCPQCPRFDQDGFLSKNLTPGHLDFDNFSRHFNLAQLPNVSTIIFEGDYGDIMMHPRAEDFLRHCSTIQSVIAYTNGSMRSAAWWAKLATIPNLTVVFSIDGLADTNAIYRINADFDKIMRNASAYINAGGRAIWKFLVFEHNQHQLEQVKSLASDMGFSDFQTQSTNRNFWENPTWPVKVNGEYQYDIKMSSSAGATRTKDHVVAFDRIKNHQFNSPVCSWIKSGRIYINHKGHVIPCCMTSGKSWQTDMSARMWQRIIQDISAIDINCHDIEHILAGDFFTSKLQESLSSSKTVHPTCVSQCS